jgi:hypothetical protein
MSKIDAERTSPCEERTAWKRPIAWTRMLVQLDILFEGRLPA